MQFGDGTPRPDTWQGVAQMPPIGHAPVPAVADPSPGSVTGDAFASSVCSQPCGTAADCPVVYTCHCGNQSHCTGGVCDYSVYS